ncbi:MAG: ATP-binding protein [Tannerella sp.]|jgi:hypothetical protein|nr:ATP-binding protein [Tannerella sp.]
METGMQKKRLPYGASNFEKIRTENFVYIDKTRYIELLENENNDNLFFTRPRKFGKSLFFTMLSHYYDIKQADRFEQLFGDLYIGKHPTPRHNSYMVLNLDFSGLDTSDEKSFNISLSYKMQEYVRGFLIHYRDFIPDWKNYNEQITVEQPGVKALLTTFNIARLLNKKLYIIIDEYDHFANDLIAQGTYTGNTIYHNIVHANGSIRDFYEILKDGSKTVIDRIVLTGVTPIMLDDITSGFNISNNLSLDPRYNEMLGFTEDEVNLLMREAGVDPDMIKVDMEYYYDGYLFQSEGENKVYNPSMMLYLFDQVLKFGRKTRNIIDENLKTDYGRLQMLMQNEDNRKQLIKITKDNAIESEVIPRFPLAKLQENEYFVSLLFYLGLLTVDKTEDNVPRLKIPNYSIRTIYWDYIKEMTADGNPDVLINMNDQRLALRELAYRGNPSLFIEHISKNIFSRLSNRDLIYFDEKYIKIMILNGLWQSNLYLTISELEVSQGYTDIYMQRSHLLPEIPYEWVWEIKYLKKEDATETALKKTREQSRIQLKKYHDSYRFADRTDVRYLSLIFIGKDQFEMEEII